MLPDARGWGTRLNVAKHHKYSVDVVWTGNDGSGTKTYRGYRRDHTIDVESKASILGSSDPAFRGDPTRYNPEELLVASLSACHMLSYLHLCSVNGICVVDYRDAAIGEMAEDAHGSGAFLSVELRPSVTISEGSSSRAIELHDAAHHLCFIANSVNFTVLVKPEVTISSEPF